MKYKLIMENWRRYIRINESESEDISTEERYFGSAVAQLVKDPSLAVDGTWLETAPGLGESLGFGYSRTVYAIPENKNLVLKLARPHEKEDGSFTNAQEVKYFNKYPEFFPKVYISDKTSWQRRIIYKGLGAGKTSVKESPHALWLVADKVIPLEQSKDFWNAVKKSFPQLTEAAGLFIKYKREAKFGGDPLIEGIQDLWTLTIGTKGITGDISRMNAEEIIPRIAQKILEEKHYALRKSLSFDPDDDFYKNPDDPWGEGSKEWFLKRQDILKEAEEIYNIVGKDAKLARLIRLCDEAGIESNDIRAQNVGTDITTKTKFILLDIGIFLNDYLAASPAVDPNEPPPL